MEKFIRQRIVDKGTFLYWLRMISAGVVYLLFSIYIYLPYLRDFSPIEYMYVFNSAFGAYGCFLLSKRWTGAFTASLFAGAIYGFSPFSLSFAAFHPLGGLPLAMFSWLFLPAAYWRKVIRVPKYERSFAAVITSVLAIAAPVVIGIYFVVLSHPGFGPFFPLPLTETMTLAGLKGIAVPLGTMADGFMFSVYHLPLCGLVMGLCLYYASGRMGVFILGAVGLCMAFYRPIAMVPPVVWGLVPLLCCAILSGYGMQGLACAGNPDRGWLLGCFGVLALLSALAFISESIYSGCMIAAGAILMLGLFFTLRADVRWHFYRWMLLIAGFAIDIISGAKYILDEIFGLAF